MESLISALVLLRPSKALHCSILVEVDYQEQLDSIFDYASLPMEQNMGKGTREGQIMIKCYIIGIKVNKARHGWIIVS